RECVLRPRFGKCVVRQGRCARAAPSLCAPQIRLWAAVLAGTQSSRAGSPPRSPVVLKPAPALIVTRAAVERQVVLTYCTPFCWFPRFHPWHAGTAHARKQRFRLGPTAAVMLPEPRVTCKRHR